MRLSSKSVQKMSVWSRFPSLIGVRKMNKLLSFLCIGALGSGLVACSPGTPDDKGVLTPQGNAAELSDTEFNNLSEIQQYQVANKLMATFFKGVPADDFFVPTSITANAADLQISNYGVDFISETKAQLKLPIQNKSEIYSTIFGSPATDTEPAVEGKYNFSRPEMEFPSAYLYELPLSDEFFARWMAYKLANTILFSPAEEIDSAFVEDVETIVENLANSILSNTPIRTIIFNHQKSQTNWRRFRSPEDNTREMIEIYLGLFDRDADVPKASIACKNWSLTDENAGYILKKPSANNNTVPQLVFDTVFVTTCEDFFNAVANHPLVIPRMATVLVDLMLEVNSDPLVRSALVNDIVKSSPTTFKDIFTAIIFSKTYLLNSERPKWAEEVFFNTGGRVHWQPGSNVFRDLNRSASRGEPGSGNFKTSLALMYQPALSLKLGRFPVVPLNALGGAYLHRAIRDAVMLESSTLDINDNRGSMPIEDFISYLFLSVIARYPNQDELDTLIEIINSAGLDSSSDGRTRLVLDYLSRLPEMYYFKAVN